MLERLLAGIATQKSANLFTFSVVIVDNDELKSAREVVARVGTQTGLPTQYDVEPERSISRARNRAIRNAEGELIAFIDDDEFPAPEWLLSMYQCFLEYKVAGVFGPVRPWYDPATPQWVKKAGFFERPEHPTGFIMPWKECRTGNVLVDRKILQALDPVFRPEFGMGASDQDLFRRLMEDGHRFVWCNSAIVYEVVPLGRCRRRFLVRRAMLRGSISLRHPKGRVINIAKAAIAVPVYAVALPFLQLAGHHMFMLYLVKLCDHLGRLLALFGINPVRVRDME
jgi:glycosyltransferase involved in cell wall biosynthesis